MAHTKVTKTYSQNTGAANTFSYSGSFDVFKGTEVVALLDNVALTFTASTINESASPREYTVDTSAKTIHIGGADLSSGTIIIRPETDMGSPTPRATYAPGASVTSEDLNNNQTQLMRKAMEYDETKLSSTGGTMTGNLTLGEDAVLVIEGATDDGYETTLTVTDPTADRTITLPNVTGTVVTTGDTGTVATGMIAADAITNAKIADNALDSEHYTDGSIDADHLASSSVTTAKINADAVTSAKIADDQIDSEHYVGGSIDLEHMSANSIDSDQYVDGSIDLAHMSANSVDSDQYVDGSIDAIHLASDSVITAKIQDNAVTIAKVGCEQTTISDSDSHIPTSGAVVDYVSAQITPLGGFEAIADEDNFPTTVPAAGVIVSIADATGITVGGSNSSTTARTAGNGSDNVTINGFPNSMNSAAVPASTGMLVISTGSSHTYTFHRLLPTTDDVRQLSDDVNDFFARYRIASSAPGSNNDAGDIYFNTSNNTLYVWSGSAWVIGVTTTPNDDTVTGAKIVDDAIDSEHYTDGSIDTAHLGDDQVTYAKIQNVSATDKILGRDSSGAGIIEEITPANVRTMLNVADGANAYTHPNHSGEVTSTADGATVIANNTVDEANLKVSNAPTNGYVLTAQSGNTGGMTWELAAAGATGGNSNANGVFWENQQTVTHDYTIQNNYNAGSFGPITINSGVTVTVGSGENWTVI